MCVTRGRVLALAPASGGGPTGPESHTFVSLGSRPALAPAPSGPIGRAAGPESHTCVWLGVVSWPWPPPPWAPQPCNGPRTTHICVPRPCPPPLGAHRPRSGPRVTRVCATRDLILALAPAPGGPAPVQRAPSHTYMCDSGRAPPLPPPFGAHRPRSGPRITHARVTRGRALALPPAPGDPAAAQRAPNHTHMCKSGRGPLSPPPLGAHRPRSGP